MQTAAILLTTSLLATLTSTQKTVVYTGEPKEFQASFSLNPTQSAVVCPLGFPHPSKQSPNSSPQVSKYTADIVPAVDALETASFASDFNNYLATASALPTNAVSDFYDVLQGAPVPTNAYSDLPASLRDPLVSTYDAIATQAQKDLSADPALSTVAPYYVVPEQEADAPKETEVLPTTGQYAPTGIYGTRWGKGYGNSVSTSFATLATASGSGSGTAAGVAAPSGVAASSGSGAASISGTISPSSTAASSPITSAKPASGASRLSAGVGALLVVGAGFIALL